jgi:hypothetical protein
VEHSGTNVQLRLPEKDVSIKVINGSFLKLAELVDVKAFDLATAAAVLDLLTEKMLHQLLGVLSENEVVLLATINYAGMGFEPETAKDRFYAECYGQHMQRDQAFGKTLGPDCTQSIKTYCSRNDLNLISGESNWIVKSKDKRMHQFLLEYMTDAIPEMLNTGQELETFQIWMNNKLDMLENEKLQTTVFHYDVFVTFG